MAQRVLAVIPARLGSRRFPGKVIYRHRGKPLLFYVHREVNRCRHVDRLVIATDSDEVGTAAREFGAEVVRTSSRHATGSDRVAEVVKKMDGDIVVDVQADSFGLKATVLDRIIEKLRHERGIEFATLACRIDNDDELFDPNKVKIVMDADGSALWFSRYPLPYLNRCRDAKRSRQFPFMRHIGVYFYRRQALERFADWRRSKLERAESLEQLRILENRGNIRVFKTRMRMVSVDSPEDLYKIDSLYD